MTLTLLANRRRILSPGILLLCATFLLLFSGMPGYAGTEANAAAPAKSKHNGKEERMFSAVVGTTSKPDTVSWPAKRGAAIRKIELTGENKDEFVIVSAALDQKEGSRVIVVFRPSKGRVGIARAQLVALNGKGEVSHEIALTGLSAKGLEGENEPPLSRVFDALGYRINLGWESLANHCKPALQGDEIAASLFEKAKKGSVRITPVARYSPDFKLPFGYYTNVSKGPVKHQVGTLAKAGPYPEHQALFPKVEGNTSFDPGKAEFGFFVSGPDHSAYSEDHWNQIFHKENVGHPVRIYAAKDRDGKAIKDAFFICFEEARNGDYNDYVFLVENIKPVNATFTTLFNGKNLDGWDLFLEGSGNTDPDQNFRIENGTLHVNGRQVGYVITEKSFTNYHFRVDFKWGQKRWPPRENTKRDAGVCYHIAPEEPFKIWPKCVECQIQEGDVGDFWLIGMTTIEVDGKRSPLEDYQRLPKRKDAERPTGQWNTLEILSYNGKCIHILNGEVVNYGENASISSGRILLQSEYAEIYYKNVMIRELGITH